VRQSTRRAGQPAPQPRRPVSFIIDGFPWNRQQAEFFAESYDIDAVIYLDLADSQVGRRVLARRLAG
jgi:adenylate kinase family enzyme